MMATKAKPVVHKTPGKKERYIEAVGRRKTAIARVRITPGSEAFMVNQKKVADYFTVPRFLKSALDPLVKMNVKSDLSVSAKVLGGGPMAQAEAIRHGLSRALIVWKKEMRAPLKTLGFLTRDSRMVERKKYGLKKARRAPQWQKR